MGPYGVAAAYAGHTNLDRIDKGFFDSMFDPGISLLSFYQIMNQVIELLDLTLQLQVQKIIQHFKKQY